MANVLPRDLDAAVTVPADAALIIDDGITVEKATPSQIVEAGRPLASQAQAEAGSNNANSMSSLRVKQAIDAQAVTKVALASDSGFTLIKHKRGESGTFARTAAQMANLEMFGPYLSVSNWIDPDYDTAIRNQTLTGVDLSGAISNALIAAKSTGLPAQLPRGRLPMASTVFLTGVPVSLIGDPFGRPSLGSTPAPRHLRWEGGASPMFSIAVADVRLEGFSAFNHGAATDFVEFTDSQRCIVRRIGFATNGGPSPSQPGRFSRSVFRMSGNQGGYSVFEDNFFGAAAPRIFDIDGLGTSNGVTPMTAQRNLVEANADGSVTFFYVRGETIESLRLFDNTLNQFVGAELLLVDTRDAPAEETISQLIVKRNEFDYAAPLTTQRMGYLTNVPQCVFAENTIQGGGDLGGGLVLVNSTVVCPEASTWERVGGDIFICDATSKVLQSGNFPRISTSRRFANNGPTGRQIYTSTSGGTVVLQGERLPVNDGVVEVVVGHNGPWTLSFNHFGTSGQGYFIDGQNLQVIIKNTSGGVIQAPTLAGGATYWRVAGAAFPTPANGNQVAVNLRFDATLVRFYEYVTRGPELAT